MTDDDDAVVEDLEQGFIPIDQSGDRFDDISHDNTSQTRCRCHPRTYEWLALLAVVLDGSAIIGLVGFRNWPAASGAALASVLNLLWWLHYRHERNIALHYSDKLKHAPRWIPFYVTYHFLAVTAMIGVALFGLMVYFLVDSVGTSFDGASGWLAALTYANALKVDVQLIITLVRARRRWTRHP